MGREPKQCFLLQLPPLKGGVGQGKEQGPALKFPVLKLFTGYGRGSREVGVKAWDPQGRGWG